MIKELKIQYKEKEKSEIRYKKEAEKLTKLVNEANDKYFDIERTKQELIKMRGKHILIIKL